MEKIAAFLARHRRVLLGAALGAAGLAVWRLVGCTSGACPMLGSAGFMLVYGGVLGALLSELFRRGPEGERDGKGGPG